MRFGAVSSRRAVPAWGGAQAAALPLALSVTLASNGQACRIVDRSLVLAKVGAYMYTNNKHRVRYLRAPGGKGRKKNQENKEEKYLDGEAEVAKRKE